MALPRLISDPATQLIYWIDPATGEKVWPGFMGLNPQWAPDDYGRGNRFLYVWTGAPILPALAIATIKPWAVQVIGPAQTPPAPAPTPPPPVPAQWGAPQRVAIQGYNGSAEEPFVTPDGYLVFDDRSDADQPGTVNHVYYARRVDDLTWTLVGEVVALAGPGAIVSDFLGSAVWFPGQATSDFGMWVAGKITNIAPVPGLNAGQPAGTMRVIGKQGVSRGWNGLACIVGQPGDAHEVAAIHADGSMTVVPLDYPQAVAFQREFAAVYTDPPGVMTSTPILTLDGLEAYFTREDTRAGSRSSHILVAKRYNVFNPFGAPEILFPDRWTEGVFLAEGDKKLYFHAPVPFPDGNVRFGIFMVSR